MSYAYFRYSVLYSSKAYRIGTIKQKMLLKKASFIFFVLNERFSVEFPIQVNDRINILHILQLGRCSLFSFVQNQFLCFMTILFYNQILLLPISKKSCFSQKICSFISAATFFMGCVSRMSVELILKFDASKMINIY